MKNIIQAPQAVVMIRPHQFFSNPQTEGDNGFQSSLKLTKTESAQRAYKEHSHTVEKLRSEGVEVHLFEDDGTRDTPDSVFPNNWFSTHTGGQIATYPMYAENRRRERRGDIIEFLKHNYNVQTVFDYSGLEEDMLALEGTGAMVIDHIGRIAYTVKSNRADPVLLERFCTHFNYEPIAFDATDSAGQPIYHTNVLMCIATEFAMVGFEMISDKARCEVIKTRLSESGRLLVDLSRDQIAQFAGNAIELSGERGRILAISQVALDTLTSAQIEIIERSARIVPISIPTIETAGGSVRCMIAGVHLTKR